MDYAPGGSLRTRHPKGIPVPLATVVQYVKEIAPALQYAHDKNIIHRDIKPENILIGRHGELLLSDFGIAMLSKTGRTSLQPSYAIGGTPEYMAPEMFSGKPEKASDQYSLGIVVYEWLCGTPPFTEGNPIQLGYQHTYVPTPSLHDKLSRIAPRVESVVMKALAKDPKERFPSVQQFADAMEEASKTPAIGTRLLTYRGHSSPIFMLVWSPNGRLIASADSQGLVQVWDSVYENTLCTYRGHAARVDTVAWSPDGRCIASGGDDSTVHIWDATTGRNVLICRGHSSVVWDVAWSPDGSFIASASEDQSVRLWDTASGHHLSTYQGHSAAVYRLAWSLDGQRIASGGNTSIVQVWSAITRRIIIILTYNGHSGWVKALEWAPDGRRIASGSYDSTVQIWDATTGRSVLTYKGHSAEVYTVSWSPNGEYIASASVDGTVQVWETHSGNHVFTYRGHLRWVGTAAWSPDGQRIASGGRDGTVQVWQALT